VRSLLKFTLDLFDASETPLPAPVAKAPPRPRARPKAVPPAAPASLLPNDVAPVKPPPPALPSAPAMPLADAMALAAFSHPRATRQLRLGNANVAFEFTRAKRKTIGFVVGAEGLSVRAPRWVPLREVDAAVQEKADWILRKLGETQQRQARLDSTRIDWCDGAVFPYMGEPVTLRLDPAHGFVGTGAILERGEGGAPHVLRMALAGDAGTGQIRDAAQAWLMREARRVFIERLDHFAPQLGVRWTKLSLSNAATRWGSASIDGAIRLHWRLIHFRLDVIDYVVAHELSHLRVMDHSPRFWDTVESVLPDYARLRRELKDEPVPR